MSDSRPSTADEKGTVVEEKPKRGFFGRKAAAKTEEEEKKLDVAPESKEPEVQPVSFGALFRCVA